jgi:hypothetical protein
MAEIQALNCPNCGGSIPDTSRSCVFCGSTVVLAEDKTKFVLAGTICTTCNYENKQGSRFCSSCGDRLSMLCPGCGEDIGLDTDYCPSCGTNVQSKLDELVKLHGSRFLSRFPGYKNRWLHMADEIADIDERLRQEAEIQKLLKKEQLLKGLNYLVHTMIIVLLTLSYLFFTGNLTYEMALQLLQDWHTFARVLYCLLIAAVIVIFIICPAVNKNRQEKEIRSGEE